jgi:hypothetical protein
MHRMAMSAVRNDSEGNRSDASLASHWLCGTRAMPDRAVFLDQSAQPGAWIVGFGAPAGAVIGCGPE